MVSTDVEVQEVSLLDQVDEANMVIGDLKAWAWLLGLMLEGQPEVEDVEAETRAMVLVTRALQQMAQRSGFAT